MKKKIHENQPKAKQDLFSVILAGFLAYIESPNPDVESYFNTHSEQNSIIDAFITMKNSKEESENFYKRLNQLPEYQQEKSKHIIRYYLSLLNDVWISNETKKNKPTYCFPLKSLEYKNNNDLRPCTDLGYYSYVHCR